MHTEKKTLINEAQVRINYCTLTALRKINGNLILVPAVGLLRRAEMETVLDYYYEAYIDHPLIASCGSTLQKYTSKRTSQYTYGTEPSHIPPPVLVSHYFFTAT